MGGNNLSTEVSGVIADNNPCGCTTGSGSLVKLGNGTLILSGINSVTGTTDVSGGALIVNGSIASSSLTRVNNGGALAGTGVVGNTLINSGGIFAPGAGTPGSSMTVLGNLAFQSGAFYLVQVNTSAASLANVSGGATLAGTVQALFAQGTYVPRSYTILHSAGLTGTFGGLMANTPANFIAALSYTSTDVLLNLIPQLGVNAGAAFNFNENAVLNAINGFINNGGSLPPAFFGLLGLTGANLANALTLLSGEAATGAQQGAFQLVSEFLSLMLDPFVDGRGSLGGAFGQANAFAPERETLPEDIALAYAKVLRTPLNKTAPFEQRWNIWGGAYGGYNKTGGDPLVVGSHDLTARTAGVAAGMDYRITPGTVVGFALGAAAPAGVLHKTSAAGAAMHSKLASMAPHAMGQRISLPRSPTPSIGYPPIAWPLPAPIPPPVSTRRALVAVSRPAIACRLAFGV